MATLLTLATSAWAQSAPSPTASPLPALVGALPPETKFTPQATPTFEWLGQTGDSLQLIGYFIVLAALVGAGLFFLKRGLPLRGKKSTDQHLNLLETKMLGNRQFLVVVEYNDSRLLLGVSPGKIQYLCPLDSELPDIDELPETGSPTIQIQPKEEK
jgi:flagellar biogenesis protein FliO